MCVCVTELYSRFHPCKHLSSFTSTIVHKERHFKGVSDSIQLPFADYCPSGCCCLIHTRISQSCFFLSLLSKSWFTSIVISNMLLRPELGVSDYRDTSNQQQSWETLIKWLQECYILLTNLWMNTFIVIIHMYNEIRIASPNIIYIYHVLHI